MTRDTQDNPFDLPTTYHELALGLRDLNAVAIRAARLVSESRAALAVTDHLVAPPPGQSAGRAVGQQFRQTSGTSLCPS